MTKFRSSLAAVFCLVLTACAGSSGVPAARIAEPQIASAYLPLHARLHLGLVSADGAAVVIAPGIAVTNAHNADLVDEKTILGFGSASDLMFFRTPRQGAPETAPLVDGAAVIAYGQGVNAELRVARGVICSIAPVQGPDSPYFIFAGNAGPGFSGGPVLDTAGRLVGITFAYVDRKGRRLIAAYDMRRVQDEYQRRQPRPWAEKDGGGGNSVYGPCEGGTG